MYEALAKGLRRVTGDICAYINAGDLYSPQAFDIVLDIFCNYPVQWLTGMQVLFNERSDMIRTQLPFVYRRQLFQCGMYGSRLPYLMQEATFWQTSLNRYLDLDRLSALKLAGDYFLWTTFCEHAQLEIVQAFLAGFKFHDNQLSSAIDAYRDEVETFIRPPTLVERLFAWRDGQIWNKPDSQKFIHNSRIFHFQLDKKRYAPGSLKISPDIDAFITHMIYMTMPRQVIGRLIDRLLGSERGPRFRKSLRRFLGLKKLSV